MVEQRDRLLVEPGQLDDWPERPPVEKSKATT
jgi:hypothetical protein